MARELYDHRRDREQGYLETINLVKKEELAEKVKELSRYLREMVPYD